MTNDINATISKLHLDPDAVRRANRSECWIAYCDTDTGEVWVNQYSDINSYDRYHDPAIIRVASGYGCRSGFVNRRWVTSAERLLQTAADAIRENARYEQEHAAMDAYWDALEKKHKEKQAPARLDS